MDCFDISRGAAMGSFKKYRVRVHVVVEIKHSTLKTSFAAMESSASVNLGITVDVAVGHSNNVPWENKVNSLISYPSIKFVNFNRKDAMILVDTGNEAVGVNNK